MSIENTLLSKCVAGGLVEALVSRQIAPHHFEDELNQAVYAAMIRHMSKYGAPPSRDVVMSEFPGFKLAVVQDTIEYLIDQFVIHVQRREAQRAVLDIAQQIDTNSKDVSYDTLFMQYAERVAQSIPSTKISKLSDAAGRLDRYKLMQQTGRVPGIPFGIPTIDECVLGVQKHELVVVSAPSSVGKALDVDTPIATPDGWTTMGDLRSGDTIYGSDGRHVSVTHAWPVRHNRPCYEVRFGDGSSVVADAEHLWTVSSPDARGGRRGDPTTLTTEELRAKNNYAVQVAQQIEEPTADLPIDPYVFGYWLGDGSSSASRITVGDNDVEHLISQIESAGEIYGVNSYRDGSKLISFGHIDTCSRGHDSTDRMPSGWCRSCNALSSKAQHRGVGLAEFAPPTVFTAQTRLAQLGVIDNKHIPLSYLRSSQNQRLALLQGIVDSDGHIGTSGRCDITITNFALANDIYDLVLSLGIKAYFNKRAAKIDGRYICDAYRIGFTTDMAVARLPRKRQRLPKTQPRGSRWRVIKEIVSVQSRPVRCIAVDADDSLFLAGRNLIPTHNSTILQHIALQAYLEDPGHRPVFISLEMEGEPLLKKFDTMAINFEHRALKALELGVGDLEKWETWGERVAKAPNDIIILDEVDECSVERVAAEILRWKPSAMFVDYFGIMTPISTGRDSKQYEGMANMAKALKRVPRRTLTPVFTAAQTNRAGFKEGVRADNIADTIEIFRSADIMLGLERDEEDDPLTMIAKLVKNRDGKKVHTEMHCDFDHMDFYEKNRFQRKPQLEVVPATPDLSQNPFAIAERNGSNPFMT